MSTCHKSHEKSHFIRKFTGKMPQPRQRHTLGASLRSGNACPHVTRDIRRAALYGNLQEKCHGPERGHTLCASLRSRNACPHVTRDIRRATFYGNLQEKCHVPDWAQNANTHFARACAVEMHVKYGQCRCKPTKSATTKTYILTVGLVFCIVFLAAFIT